MNKKEISASLAGNISLGGEISVHRLGFGAMRLTGDGIWGPPKDRKGALAVASPVISGCPLDKHLCGIEDQMICVNDVVDQVVCRCPGGDPEYVLQYLGRYTRRVASIDWSRWPTAKSPFAGGTRLTTISRN